MHFHVVTLENIQLFLSCYCLKVDKKKNKKTKKNQNILARFRKKEDLKAGLSANQGNIKLTFL